MDSRKSMRHFYCRDTLWETFERMANDFAVSVDYLINESMRHYAKNKGYEVGESRGVQVPSSLVNPPTVEVQNFGKKSPPPLPGQVTRKSTSRNSGAFSLSQEMYSDIPTEQPPMTLYVIYDNEKHPIDKDQFIIGRVGKLCDLVIKDSNISRKHAAVIKRNGNYYIKDLGSTNGIEYNGMRIDNKRIDEGDSFLLCENKINFTFR
ncbi:MAG: FHA domain-containing protein [Deltaproteobacteria bacterium]|nr:FHA domain-containing protein [Deltaproteobacteria bacterium]